MPTQQTVYQSTSTVQAVEGAEPVTVSFVVPDSRPEIPDGDDMLDEQMINERLVYALSKRDEDPSEIVRVVELLRANQHRLPAHMQKVTADLIGSLPLASVAHQLSGNGHSPNPATVPAAPAIAGERQVVALLASHISNPTRLAYLRDCFDSIKEQTVLPSMLLIGLSCEPIVQAELNPLLEGIAQELHARGCTMRVRFTGVKLSQFEHYKGLLQYLEGMDALNTWVFFSDDDDVWHPNRTASYAEAFRRAPPHIGSMVSPVYAVNVRPVTPGARVHWSDLQVQRFGAQDGTDNYWAMATRLKLWREYFDETPDPELKSTYADVNFCQYIKLRPESVDPASGTLMLVESIGGEDNWMYLWRQDHQGNPQHTEQQKEKLTPVVKEGLEQYFSRPVNKKRFCDDMMSAMGMAPAMLEGGGGRGGGGGGGGNNNNNALAQMATVDMMVNGFLQDVVSAESSIEIYRVNLRSGMMSLDEIDLNGGKTARTPEEAELIRATLNPEVAQTFEYAKKVRSQKGPLADLGSKIFDHTSETMEAYKRTRLKLMAAKGYAYEPVTPKAVHEAFMRCMMGRSFM